MTILKTRQYIQDAPDFDYQLKPTDEGKYVTVHNGQFIVSDLKVELPQSYYIGTNNRIQSAIDGPGELNSSSQGKALTYDDVTKKFVMTTLSGTDAATLQSHPASDFVLASTYIASDVLTKIKTVDGSGSGLDSDLLDGIDSLGFIKADGTVIGATSQAQSFTLGVGINTNSPDSLLNLVSNETPSTTIATHIGNTGGVELITSTVNRDFSGAGNWTGTNWAISGGALLHTTGSTTVATLLNANLTAASIISGRFYQITYTIAGITAGTVTPKLGAVSGTAQSANGTYTDTLACTADNADVAFTPTSTFDGSIDNISVKRVATNFVVLNSGRVGIGLQAPTTMLEVLDQTNTPFTCTRQSLATATSNGAFNAMHSTPFAISDGFGVHQSFRIQDITAVATTIGQVGFVRDGALNTGAGVIRCTSAGTVTERARWNNLGTYTQSQGDAVTNTVVNTNILKKTSSGTPAAGFGSGINVQLKSSTTVDQDAGRLTWEWDVATHASRASRGKLSAYFTTTERVCVDWKADSTSPLIGFLGATPVVQQTSGANLTNNVTSGGSNDTIANYTDLSTYANDAAAIRNNIYQLSRKLKQVNDALRLFGLLT